MISRKTVYLATLTLVAEKSHATWNRTLNSGASCVKGQAGLNVLMRLIAQHLDTAAALPLSACPRVLKASLPNAVSESPMLSALTS